MKNVLFIESGVYGGGSFVSLVKHLKALDRTKINPVVVFFNDSEHRANIQSLGIKTVLVQDDLFTGKGKKSAKILNALFIKGFLPFWNGFFLKKIHHHSISDVKKIIRDHSIDYVHLNTEIFRDRVGLLAASEQNIPVISHLRSKYDTSKIGKLSTYVLFSNYYIKKYICVSEETKAFWTKVFKIHNDSEVIYDYFEMEDKFEKTSKAFSNPVQLLCPANLIPVKGHPFLINSLAPLLLVNKVSLILAGKGEDTYTYELKNLCKELNIEKNVQFLGFRSDMSDLMKSSDIVILASKREGMPNALIEAMGLGSIVIATNVGGIPEIINDKENGFLVDYNDEQALRDVIQEIMDNRYNLIEIRKNAMQKVTDHFSLNQYQQKIKSLYE